MKVHVQPISGVLRVWNNPDAHYGQPYDWACTLRYLDEETVEFLGVTQPVTVSLWRAIRAELAKTPIKRVLAVRRTCNKTRERWLYVERKK